MNKTLKALAAVAFVASASACYAQTSPFPSGLDSLSTLKYAINGLSTQLTGAITTTVQTTLQVSSCQNIVANVLITIDTEIMPVSGCTGTVLVVGSRGFDNSGAATHAAGALISAYVDAWHINSPDSAIIAIETALGTNLANVVSSSAILTPAHGGTGVNNGSFTATLGGNLLTGGAVTFSGAFNATLVVPGSLSWSLPSSAGTLVGSGDTGTVTNAMLAGSIAPAKVTGTAVTQADTATVTDTMLAGFITNDKLVAPVVVTNCGSSASCATPATATNYKVALGTIAFSAATTATITGISPAFTGTTSYTCIASDPSHAYTVTTQNQSSSSFIITAGTSNSDTWTWHCSGL